MASLAAGGAVAAASAGAGATAASAGYAYASSSAPTSGNAKLGALVGGGVAGAAGLAGAAVAGTAGAVGCAGIMAAGAVDFTARGAAYAAKKGAAWAAEKGAKIHGIQQEYEKSGMAKYIKQQNDAAKERMREVMNDSLETGRSMQQGMGEFIIIITGIR